MRHGDTRDKKSEHWRMAMSESRGAHRSRTVIMINTMALQVLSVIAIGIFVAVFEAVPVVQADTLCYSCHLAPGRNDCMDNAVLHNVRAKFDNLLNRNVSEEDAVKEIEDYMSICDSTLPFCVIERIIGAGEFKLMYRDCSDGLNFATDVTSTRLISLLRTLDNNTHCTYQQTGQNMVCISLCKGFLCNGPQPSAGVVSMATPLSLLLSVLATWTL